jgi:hypothetical protein
MYSARREGRELGQLREAACLMYEARRGEERCTSVWGTGPIFVSVAIRWPATASEHHPSIGRGSPGSRPPRGSWVLACAQGALPRPASLTLHSTAAVE